jgi:hypothetical protein
LNPLLILDCNVPSLPPLSDPMQFESVFLRSYSQGQPKIMRHYGDSILRTVTYDVLAELFGNENDSVMMKAVPWAVSNAFYEQIVLYYGLEHLRPQLPLHDSRRLRIKRGDVLEAYTAGIVMDVSREIGEGYQEIRAWFDKVIRLRLRNACSGSSLDLSLVQEKWNELPKHPVVHTQLSDLRQSVFDSLKGTIGQVQWTTAIPTVSQLIDFWSRVKSNLDAFCTTVLPCEEPHIIVLLHYRVYLDSFTFSLLSRMLASNLMIDCLPRWISIHSCAVNTVCLIPECTRSRFRG